MSQRIGRNPRYAPVRGTQNDVLRVVRGRDWFEGVPALAERLGRTDRQVWLAVVGLANRELVRARVTAEGVVLIKVTRAGRLIRL